MDTLAAILKSCGQSVRGLYLKIENPPYLPLVIEDTHEKGPNGLPAISVAHYGELNGDLMRDPEMLFEVEAGDDEIALRAFYFRNDYAGVEQYSASRKGDVVVVDVQLRAEHKAFAELWDQNLREQEFLKSFLKQRPQQIPS